MTSPALLAVACLLAGCTHASVVATSGGATTTTVTSASVAVSGGGSGAAAWALIGIGLIAAEAVNPVRPLEPPPGPLDPRRRINEVDCTKPITDWSANLKCK